MKKNRFKRWGVSLLLLAGLFFGLALAVGVTFKASPAFAQTADGAGNENEAHEQESGEGPDIPITGAALEQARAAALSYLGEGRVTETEVGDEEGYYEVEITREDGRQVDVHRDENFNVLGHEDD